MANIYFTVSGTNHYHGQEFIEPGMKVMLEKEPENEYDSEAIKVVMPGIGQIGYVANSPYTVLGESMSAGRIYDKIGNTAVSASLNFSVSFWRDLLSKKYPFCLRAADVFKIFFLFYYNISGK